MAVPKGLTDHPILEGEILLPSTVKDVGYKQMVISSRESERNELNLKKALEAAKISDKPQAAILSEPQTEVEVNDEMT